MYIFLRISFASYILVCVCVGGGGISMSVMLINVGLNSLTNNNNFCLTTTPSSLGYRETILKVEQYWQD